jgi:mannose-1-phosphate guanylyltransferase
MHTLIMAGGGGTRFWPRSRQQRPKQFLALSGERTLIQLALDRVEAQTPPERTWVITAECYHQETARQLPELEADHIIGEPCGRDTAPCIAVGAGLIARHDPDAIMLVTPADHVIEPMQEFRRAVHVAAQMAEEHPRALITFGITPTFPSTGYGYIQRGPEIASRQGVAVQRVQKFHEKPKADLAQEFFASGQYYWNSGIFVWKASAILEELKQQRPALHAAALRIASAWDQPDRRSVLAREYQEMEKISIDYAVMQDAGKAGKVLVVQAPFQWDDVGSWLALERMNPQDAGSNTVIGTHCGIKTGHCIIVAEPGKLVATIGVEHLVIVQDGAVTLVADKRDENSIRQLIEELKKRGLEQYL